jgi:hypothetical protein
VTGELPRSEGSGFAIIRFARDYRVYITLYAEEPKPKSHEEEMYASWGLKPPPQKIT